MGFTPLGGPCEADPISLGADEVEALRLSDIEGLYQDAAAARMGVSRQTYARILHRARSAVARGLIEQRMLLVESGAVQSPVADPPPGSHCPIHGGPRRRGRACHCPIVDAEFDSVHTPPGCARRERP